MTRRERILTTMNHQRPDRVPAVLAARPEVNRMLMQHFGVSSMAEVHSILGTDGWAEVRVAIDWSDFEKKTNGRLEGDCPYAGREYIFHDENTFEDEWGVIRSKGRDGKYVQWVSGPLVDAQDPDEYDFPTIGRLIDDPELPKRVSTLKRNDYFVDSGVQMPYKTAWQLRGMEKLLADYIVNPEFVEKLYDSIYPLYGEVWARAVESGVDMIGVGGDIAMHDRVMMGPDAWRRIDKPRMAEIISRSRKINPDVHVFIHSDGNLWEIMEDLIEIGFDVIDPIQPECMDPVEVKKRWGDRIVLHGGGSVQHTLPFGTVAEVHQEVTRLIENCGYNGGFVLRASNAISFDCPLENILTFFETARDYNW